MERDAIIEVTAPALVKALRAQAIKSGTKGILLNDQQVFLVLDKGAQISRTVDRNGDIVWTNFDVSKLSVDGQNFTNVTPKVRKMLRY